MSLSWGMTRVLGSRAGLMAEADILLTPSLLHNVWKRTDEQNLHFFCSAPLCQCVACRVFSSVLPQLAEPDVPNIISFTSSLSADRCKEVQQIREQHPSKIPVSCHSRCSASDFVLVTPLLLHSLHQPATEVIKLCSPEPTQGALHRPPVPYACQRPCSRPRPQQCKIQSFF